MKIPRPECCSRLSMPWRTNSECKRKEATPVPPVSSVTKWRTVSGSPADSIFIRYRPASKTEDQIFQERPHSERTKCAAKIALGCKQSREIDQFILDRWLAVDLCSQLAITGKLLKQRCAAFQFTRTPRSGCRFSEHH